MFPTWVIGLGAKLAGVNFKALLPILPYALAFGVGWFGNGWRLDANRIEAELKTKDAAIAQANIRAAAASELAASKDLLVAEYRASKEASEARVGALEGNLVELSLRQPKDTTRIIDNTRDIADEVIDENSEYAWLNNPYPAVMLNNANRRIAASKDYGLPLPPLAGDWPDRSRSEDAPALRGYSKP